MLNYVDQIFLAEYIDIDKVRADRSKCGSDSGTSETYRARPRK